MRTTEILFKKAKSKRIMVLMESVVSGHQFNTFRDRLAEKLEVLRFDPYRFPLGEVLLQQQLQQESIYRERRKIRSA